MFGVFVLSFRPGGLIMRRIVVCLSVCVLLLVSVHASAADPPAKDPGIGVALRDFDKDGFLDLVVAGPTSRQAGKGVVFADLDGDGFPDVLIFGKAPQPVRPVIDTIRIEGGRVKITGDSIEVRGGKIEIIRRLR
jgi:hypothetical protein